MASSPSALAGSPPIGVKLEPGGGGTGDGSGSATPRASLHVPNAVGAASGAASPFGASGNATRASSIQLGKSDAERVSSLAAKKADSAQVEPPSLFDPSHIPTLFTRIQTISQLILEASENADSLFLPRKGADGQSNAGGETMETDSSTVIPHEPNGSAATSLQANIALGATTDDDVNEGYEAALSMTMDNDDDEGARNRRNARPTALTQSLVRESTALRSAFTQAQRAVKEMPGGDMDLEEQTDLINLLQHYFDEQSRIRTNFVQQSAKVGAGVQGDTEASL